MAGKKLVTSKSLGHFANSKSGTTSLKQKNKTKFLVVLYSNNGTYKS